MFKTFTILFIIFFYNSSIANNIGSETGFELPRYVSIKSNNSNLRVGPSENYPIQLKYISSNFPLMIIDEYENWRKVVDNKNNTGWMHKRLLKGERNAIITSPSNQNIKIYNTADGNIIGEVAPGLIVKLKKCKIDWCLIQKDKYQGWIKKNNIWGVKAHEIFNISYIQYFYDYYFISINNLSSLIKTNVVK